MSPTAAITGSFPEPVDSGLLDGEPDCACAPVQAAAAHRTATAKPLTERLWLFTSAPRGIAGRRYTDGPRRVAPSATGGQTDGPMVRNPWIHRGHGLH